MHHLQRWFLLSYKTGFKRFATDERGQMTVAVDLDLQALDLYTSIEALETLLQ